MKSSWHKGTERPKREKVLVLDIYGKNMIWDFNDKSWDTRLLNWETYESGIDAWKELPNANDPDWEYEKLPVPSSQDDWMWGRPRYMLLSASGRIWLGWYGEDGWYIMYWAEDANENAPSALWYSASERMESEEYKDNPDYMIKAWMPIVPWYH